MGLSAGHLLQGYGISDPPRPIGYYYEDEDEYEAKSIYVGGGGNSAEDEAREQRMRIAQQHMYVPGTN